MNNTQSPYEELLDSYDEVVKELERYENYLESEGICQRCLNQKMGGCDCEERS